MALLGSTIAMQAQEVKKEKEQEKRTIKLLLEETKAKQKLDYFLNKNQHTQFKALLNLLFK